MATARASDRKPRILLTFANEAASELAWLRALPAEVRALREALKPAQDAGLCSVEVETNASVDTLIEALQRPSDAPLAIFHYAGHASGDALFLESEGGGPQQAHAGGLARLLSRQPGLQVVFLNGCSTEPQVRRLLDLGVPAVIATNRAIDDGVATRFAQTFYHRLAEGKALREAFADAEAAVMTAFGEGGALFRTEVTRSFAPVARAEEATGDLPWKLSVAPGAEPVEAWSLPEAAGDPLFGLPPLPDLDLPPRPFLHLQRYRREDCAIFFGRAHKIRELYDALTATDRPPVLVLHGPSGAGKSSLLEAGLLPRLESVCTVDVLRRDGATGLPAMIRAALGVEAADPAVLLAAWRRREEAEGRPLILILDQVEEILTRGEDDAELATLMDQLAALFGRRSDRPRGRALLTLRSEWLAALLGPLEQRRLPIARAELRHLGRDDVQEVILGPVQRPALQVYYGLSVDPELPALIAADLTSVDAEAAVAPTLAVLLSRLLDAAGPGDVHLGVRAYEALKSSGLMLDDFLSAQLAWLDDRYPQAMEVGLPLDVLFHHLSRFGSSVVRQADELRLRYAHVPDCTALLVDMKERHLLAGDLRLVDGALVGSSRLAHDTLGPVVRARFEASNLPGQRARRIIRERVREWEGGRVGGLLAARDLDVVLRGQRGMAALRPDGQRLVDASVRYQRTLRRDRKLIWAGVASLVLAVLGSAWLAWQGRIQTRVARQLSAEGNTQVTAREQAMEETQAARIRARDICKLSKSLANRFHQAPPACEAQVLCQLSVDEAGEPVCGPAALLCHVERGPDGETICQGESPARVIFQPPLRCDLGPGAASHWTFKRLACEVIGTALAVEKRAAALELEAGVSQEFVALSRGILDVVQAGVDELALRQGPRGATDAAAAPTALRWLRGLDDWLGAWTGLPPLAIRQWRLRVAKVRSTFEQATGSLAFADEIAERLYDLQQVRKEVEKVRKAGGLRTIRAALDGLRQVQGQQAAFAAVRAAERLAAEIRADRRLYPAGSLGDTAEAVTELEGMISALRGSLASGHAVDTHLLDEQAREVRALQRPTGKRSQDEHCWRDEDCAAGLACASTAAWQTCRAASPPRDGPDVLAVQARLESWRRAWEWGCIRAAAPGDDQPALCAVLEPFEAHFSARLARVDGQEREVYFHEKRLTTLTHRAQLKLWDVHLLRGADSLLITRFKQRYVQLTNGTHSVALKELHWQREGDGVWRVVQQCVVAEDTPPGCAHLPPGIPAGAGGPPG